MNVKHVLQDIFRLQMELAYRCVPQDNFII